MLFEDEVGLGCTGAASLAAGEVDELLLILDLELARKVRNPGPGDHLLEADEALGIGKLDGDTGWREID